MCNSQFSRLWQLVQLPGLQDDWGHCCHFRRSAIVLDLRGEAAHTLGAETYVH